jgi:hypothetical protein
MTRSGIFGWSLPPGVTNRMIDEAYGREEPCEVCGQWPDDCICPECPICGEYGRSGCYGKIPAPGLLAPYESGNELPHGLVRSAEQIELKAAFDKAQREIVEAEALWADSEWLLDAFGIQARQVAAMTAIERDCWLTLACAMPPELHWHMDF